MNAITKLIAGTKLTAALGVLALTLVAYGTYTGPANVTDIGKQQVITNSTVTGDLDPAKDDLPILQKDSDLDKESDLQKESDLEKESDLGVDLL